MRLRRALQRARWCSGCCCPCSAWGQPGGPFCPVGSVSEWELLSWMLSLPGCVVRRPPSCFVWCLHGLIVSFAPTPHRTHACVVRQPPSCFVWHPSSLVVSFTPERTPHTHMHGAPSCCFVWCLCGWLSALQPQISHVNAHWIYMWIQPLWPVSANERLTCALAATLTPSPRVARRCGLSLSRLCKTWPRIPGLPV